jgi:hypothetical protein
MKHNMGYGMHESSKHATYKNEVEEPALPMEGAKTHSCGCADFKAQAMPIAFGMASKEGIAADEKRMSSQFKDYHWADGSAGE